MGTKQRSIDEYDIPGSDFPGNENTFGGEGIFSDQRLHLRGSFGFIDQQAPLSSLNGPRSPACPAESVSSDIPMRRARFGDGGGVGV